MDTEGIRRLAESSEARAQALHKDYDEYRRKARLPYQTGEEKKAIFKLAQGKLNDFFYWSGKATAYRGIIAMIELATVVEDELEAEGSCP